MPCEHLSFDIADDEFVRDYRLEVLPDTRDAGRRGRTQSWNGDLESYPQNGRGVPGSLLASGQWQRRAGGAVEPMDIRFAEAVVRRLRLTVTDDRNPPLTINAVRSSAAARQVIFAATPEPTPTLRLYFGNPHARPPNYDFARNLPPSLEPPPVRVTLDLPVEANPDYRPLPKPWSERWPWLIYVVLGIASLALLGILGALGRDTLRRHDATDLAAASRSRAETESGRAIQ